MKKINKLIVILLVLLISATSVFALDWDDFNEYSRKTNKYVTSSATREAITATPLSDSEQTLIKSFVALIISADDAEDFDNDGVFVVNRGGIRKRKMRGIDTYSMNNATFIPYSNRTTTFANNVNGTVAYEDDEGIYSAKLKAVFPKIDNIEHSLEITALDKYAPYNGANVVLDGKNLVLDYETIHDMMLGGYEVALEYLFW